MNLNCRCGRTNLPTRKGFAGEERRPVLFFTGAHTDPFHETPCQFSGLVAGEL